MVRRIKKQGKTTKKKIAVKIANLVTSDGQRGTKIFLHRSGVLYKKSFILSFFPCFWVCFAFFLLLLLWLFFVSFQLELYGWRQFIGVSILLLL